jgi:alditol oxidase
MSMNYGQDTVGIHFTWKPEREAVEGMLVQLETALAPFEARPHWGKLFNADAAALAPLCERMPYFIRLIERLDPRGAFCNSWLKARVLGESRLTTQEGIGVTSRRSGFESPRLHSRNPRFAGKT